MVGSKRVDTGPGDQDADVASSSLRNSLAVAGQLAKEVDIFKKQQFEMWEVGGVGLAGRGWWWLCVSGRAVELWRVYVEQVKVCGSAVELCSPQSIQRIGQGVLSSVQWSCGEMSELVVLKAALHMDKSEYAFAL